METLTEEEQIAYGELFAKLLKMKKNKEHKDRWDTAWGTKTNLGLYRTIKRLVEDAENKKEITLSD